MSLPERLIKVPGALVDHHVPEAQSVIVVATVMNAGSDDMLDEIERRWNAFPALVEALETISRGEGRFSRDQLEFATNVIEEAKACAQDALAAARREP